jgi:hypothetical protein
MVMIATTKIRYGEFLLLGGVAVEYDKCDANDVASSLAFENFFDDWVSNVRGAGKGPDWGREYWQSHGVDVQNGRVVFASPQDRTLFLLKWS